MIIVLRLLFIAITSILSGLYFFSHSWQIGVIATVISILLSLGIVIVIEYLAHTVSTQIFISLFFGLLIGLSVSLLAIALINYMPIPVKAMVWVKLVVGHIITFWITIFFVIKNEEIGFLQKILPNQGDPCVGSISYKILDTSVIIDGRISDICESGFLEGVLVIPTFVLNELQLIADSADSLKRNRGRRGLDILNKMQKDETIKVKISDLDFADISEVDAKLVKLAKVMKAKVITNDFNLNKVAEFHGVDVLNINELSNALRPVVLPGEEMHVSLIKEGKDQNQAIGYLDDGTMVVVENGRKRLNYDVDVVVTSVLQTTAGRMIFARIRD